MEFAVLQPPARDRRVGWRRIMLEDPISCLLVVGISSVLGQEEPPAWPQYFVERGDHCIDIGMVQRHDGRNGIEAHKSRRMLDALLPQRWMSWGAWINAECVEAEFGESIDEPAITAAHVEDSRA